MAQPNSILYECVAKGTTILADFDPTATSLLTLASHCLHFTPPHHSVYSHTVSGRTYHFLIDGADDDFVYFAIFDDDVAGYDSEERLRFLKGVKLGFGEIVVDLKTVVGDDDLSFKCFQDEMDLVFRRLLEMGSCSGKFINRNVSSDSSCSSQMNVVKPLLGYPEAENAGRIRNGERNDVRRMESKVDVAEEFGNEGGLSDPFSAEKVYNDDNADDTLMSYRERKKARWTWRARVGLVLLVDFLVCLLLFGAWMWVCQGFECLSR